MIAKLIRWSVANRFLVLLATAMLTAWGVWGVRSTPVDALPDLSDVQVIIRTNYPGQAPQIVENQVTYPLATTMLSVPGAKTVRGFSFFGDSFVYVLFEDGTDLYWARSRVLEYLNQVQGRLPATAKPALGPDATGVGWIFQYALVDRTGKNDLAQLRALQDWFLKFELKSLPNVAEVASVGGMVKQYQVVLDPIKLASYGLSQAQVRDALMAANQETGGSVLELSGAEYMVRASGYLKTLDEFREIPLTARGGVPVRLGDVATLQIGPEMRRGIAELDGEGEVAGGVVVLRSGKNAQETIAAVKAKLAELQGSLPPGVEIVTTYDRSALIERAIRNLTTKLGEEFLVVALVCALFLWHLRSALVAIISLPLGVMTAFLVMRYQGINANIMSLGGDCHRRGGDGGCSGGDDRERPQEAGGLAARAPRSTAAGQGTVGRDHTGRGGSRSCALLLAAHHHALVHPGLHPRSAGRPAVRPAGVHQDLRDGRGRRAVSDADSRTHGLLDSRAYPG